MRRSNLFSGLYFDDYFQLDLPTCRAQIFSRARSATGRFFMFSAAKASEKARASCQARANYWNRKSEKRRTLRKTNFHDRESL